jgi:hypothetical protein
MKRFQFAVVKIPVNVKNVKTGLHPNEYDLRLEDKRPADHHLSRNRRSLLDLRNHRAPDT